ncbi:MAG TPA: DUF3445 domain-containing protein [Stellaceae bacterium]|nr:DUF3445 domain-containing protein [Stellaceae bacterium]
MSEEERAPYRPFDGGRFRPAMGLMPLNESNWLEIDRHFAAGLAEKRALLAERHGEVFAALPAAAAPASELLALLAAHLPRHHPEIFRRENDRLFNRANGEDWDLTRGDLHPLDLAGRLVQEDLCLLEAASDSYRLIGATLCSPSRWRLAEKIGRPLAAIHAPVPGYGAALARPVDRFFAHLKPGKLVWRLNWGVLDDPAPFQPVAAPAASITAEKAGELLWLRVERQTLRRLVATGAVVFAIRTHITPLAAAIRMPADAADLAAAIRAMPEDMRRYKRIALFAPAVLAWLDQRAGAAAAPVLCWE